MTLCEGSYWDHTSEDSRLFCLHECTRFPFVHDFCRCTRIRVATTAAVFSGKYPHVLVSTGGRPVSPGNDGALEAVLCFGKTPLNRTVEKWIELDNKSPVRHFGVALILMRTGCGFTFHCTFPSTVSMRIVLFQVNASFHIEQPPGGSRIDGGVFQCAIKEGVVAPLSKLRVAVSNINVCKFSHFRSRSRN